MQRDDLNAALSLAAPASDVNFINDQMGEGGAILEALDHGNGSCREDQPSATRSTHLAATCIAQLRTQTGID